MNILIAEDNQIIQMIQRTLMENWGFKYDLAANGLEAVEYAKKNNGKYDLCLMDIDMPKMNGIEATKIIRRVVDYFPILALTADDTHKVASLEAGMDDFAVKPCSQEDLLARIKKLTVKAYKLIAKSSGLDITEVMPVDKKHAEEIRELAEQGLCKMNIRGIGEHDLTVIVHKGVPYKISNDFVGNGDDVSVFLDRSSDRPAECHLYKSSFPMPTVYLKEEVFAERLEAENELLKDCTSMVIKPNNQ